MHLHTTDQYNERHSTIFHSGLQKFCSITPLIIVAVLLTCIQVAIAMSYSSGSKISERYLALRNWDARGYERIASEGYVWNAKMTEADVVWYPGHPIVIRIIQYLTHSSWRFSTLLASQVACVLFWTYFLLFLRRFIIPFYLQILSVTAVLFYPTSFYLISGYSEALFLGSILGMLYWMHDEGKYSLALAIAFAFIVSSTRITAIALIPLPLFFGLVHRRWWSGLFLALALGIGSLLYFAFLYVAFDNFFLYFHVY